MAAVTIIESGIKIAGKWYMFYVALFLLLNLKSASGSGGLSERAGSGVQVSVWYHFGVLWLTSEHKCWWDHLANSKARCTRAYFTTPP